MSGSWSPSSGWTSNNDGPYISSTAIIEGAWEEDEPFTRSKNHFWDPDLSYDNGIVIPFVTTDSALEAAQDRFNNAVSSYQSNPSMSYWWLGRAAHLLMDMSVPAHAMLDWHGTLDYTSWGINPTGTDSYEQYTAYSENYKNITYTSSFTSVPNYASLGDFPMGDFPRYTPPSGYDNYLTRLMYNMAEYGDNYDSDNEDGDNTNGTYNDWPASNDLITSRTVSSVQEVNWLGSYRKPLDLMTDYELHKVIDSQNDLIYRIYYYRNYYDTINNTTNGVKVYYTNGTSETFYNLDELTSNNHVVPGSVLERLHQVQLESRAIGYVAALYQLFWDETHPPAGMPSSITVPSSDSDGSYTVSWGTSSTSRVIYVLEEATNSSFSSGLTTYAGTSTSASITGRSSGTTYYYRVKATRSGYSDSSWQTGSNGCEVGSTPPSPPIINSPGTPTDTGFEISTTTPTFKWTNVSNAVRYGLYISKEPYGSSNIIYQNEQLTGTSFTIPSGELSNGVKYRWNMVAYNSTGQESAVSNDKLYFKVVTSISTAGTPSSITMPSNDSDGSYTVSWGTSSTSSVTYVLEEATNLSFSSDLRTAYSGTPTSTTITGRSSGTTYYYRVKATRSGYTDSAWRTGSNGCTVTITQTVGTPSSITIPSIDSDGSYSISWGTSSTSSVAYTLEEATNSSFSSGFRTAYSGTSTSTTITGCSSGTTYYYRVKATRSGYTDSAWRTGSNGCTVTITQTVGTPSSISVPSSDSDGSYSISWGTSSTSSVTYVLEEATNLSFSSGLRTAYSGSSTTTTITGRSSGTIYYYRVKAIRSGYTDSSWRTGSNGCTVTITPTNNNWPMFHNDAANTGFSPDTDVPAQVQMIWRYTCGGGYSPAIVDGVVYFGASNMSGDDVIALNANTGSRIWSYNFGGTAYVDATAPAVDNGSVYVTGSTDSKSNGTVYSFDAATGSLKWSYSIGDYIFKSSPKPVDGKIYFGASDNKVYCLNASNGSLVWSYPTASNVSSTPAIVNGIVYIGSDDQKCYALNSNTGNLIWVYDTGNDGYGGSIQNAPAVANGKVYFRSSNYFTYCLNASNGSVIWKRETSGPAGSVAVAYGNVYIADYEGMIYGLNADNGNINWSYSTGTNIASSPVIANNVVYIVVGGDYDADLIALNASNGTLLWNIDIGNRSFISSVPAIADGKIFVADMDSYLYAFGSVPTAGTPSSITVPSSDSDGSYTVSWGSSSTSSVIYVLEEATNSSFSSGLRTAYSGSSTSTTITGRSSDMTYYYRAKATRSGYADSSWRTGSNGCTVTITQTAGTFEHHSSIE